MERSHDLKAIDAAFRATQMPFTVVEAAWQRQWRNLKKHYGMLKEQAA